MKTFVFQTHWQLGAQGAGRWLPLHACVWLIGVQQGGLWGLLVDLGRLKQGS